MFYIVAKVSSMGQHHVLEWWEHYHLARGKVTHSDLSSKSSQWYHQTSTTPPSSNITRTRNLGLGYTTSMIHQSPFGGVNQWGMPVAAPTFTPSPYISLQVITSTPIYTWRSVAPMGELKSLAKGQVPFLWRNYKQLSQLWFVNWTSSMALITLRHLHSNNCSLCALWSIRCLRATFFKDFGHHPDP
jgi:hypothetical protein